MPLNYKWLNCKWSKERHSGPLGPRVARCSLWSQTFALFYCWSLHGFFLSFNNMTHFCSNCRMDTFFDKRPFDNLHFLTLFFDLLPFEKSTLFANFLRDFQNNSFLSSFKMIGYKAKTNIIFKENVFGKIFAKLCDWVYLETSDRYNYLKE